MRKHYFHIPLPQYQLNQFQLSQLQYEDECHEIEHVDVSDPQQISKHSQYPINKD